MDALRAAAVRAATAFTRNRGAAFTEREPIRVAAPAPVHMHERLKACGWMGEVRTLVD